MKRNSDIYQGQHVSTIDSTLNLGHPPVRAATMVKKENMDTVIRRLFALKAPKAHSLVFSTVAKKNGNILTKDHPIVQWFSWGCCWWVAILCRHSSK